MEFRLIYKGRLSSNGDAPEKHLIRKTFHPQLAELWRSHPQLSKQLTQNIHVFTTPPNTVSPPGPGVQQYAVTNNPSMGKPWIEWLADYYKRGDYRFAPLIRKGEVICSLDILFLRRDSPGHLIKNTGGDIDNRIKTLFDAFRIPEAGELGIYKTPAAGENPFYCLLQDDSDIAEVRVTTDRLLLPQETLEHRDDVHLVIHVKTRTVDPNALFANIHIL